MQGRERVLHFDTCILGSLKEITLVWSVRFDMRVTITLCMLRDVFMCCLFDID
jgi:hypothetical protein